MLNEELATYLLLERTNMQHVERWNDYEAAGGVGMIFQSKGAVWNDATQRTKAKDRRERWEEDFARREKELTELTRREVLYLRHQEQELAQWEWSLDVREDEMVNLKLQGSLSERRIAARQLATKLVPERLELEGAYGRLAGEREVIEQRWTAQRMAAKLAHAERVADNDWQRTVEQAESAKSKAKTSATPIPAPRYNLSRTKAVEREANELLAAIRNEARGTRSERPVAERVNAGRMDETAETESVAVKQATELVFEGTANEKPAEVDAFPIPALRNSVSRSKAVEWEVTGQLAAGCEELADIRGHEDADLVDAQEYIGESTATVEAMAVRPEPMMVGDQGVGHGGAEGVVYERGFAKQLETESMTTVSGRSINMVGDECGRTNKLENWTKAENVGEFDVWSRIGRDNNQYFVWIEPKAVRWIVRPCARNFNWKSVRWRRAKRRISCKSVRWREVYQNETIEDECGVEGVELIEDDQHCRMADCHGR
jgi:hypothetical protein